jgi:hypothetical protein
MASQLAIWEMPDQIVIQMPMCQMSIKIAIWQMPTQRVIK